MIWGRTYRQRRLARERRAEQRAERLRRQNYGWWWAWHPVHLQDGRWAWLSTVWRERKMTCGVWRPSYWLYSRGDDDD